MIEVQTYRAPPARARQANSIAYLAERKKSEMEWRSVFTQGGETVGAMLNFKYASNIIRVAAPHALRYNSRAVRNCMSIHPPRSDTGADKLVKRKHSSMPKRTYQPKKRRRARVHGFRQRMKTKGGRAVIQARRKKGRKEITKQPKHVKRVNWNA